MKTIRLKRLLKNVVIIMIAIFTLAATLPAQNIDKSKIVNDKKCVKNLAAGISSENAGLKNSAIYYAAKYKVTGTTKALIQQLKKEESPKTRALIVYSLLMIGDDDGISAACEYATSELDEYVRKIFSEVTAEFDAGRSLAVHSNSIK
jgi:HEAT repeat protein